MRVFPLIVLAALATACAPAPPTVQGRASVIDGDTLDLHGSRIRLWGVDAPESRQLCDTDAGPERCGQIAANRLDAHMANRSIDCFEQDVDRYGRMVARCEIGGEDLGGWLVSEGLAVRYERYAGLAYLAEEISARRARRGIWRGDFQTPEEWRRDQRTGPVS